MKYVVEFKENENEKSWDYVDDNHVIEADDEKDAIEIAKAKFIEFYGGAEYAEEMGQEEYTEEEVNNWTWRAAEYFGEEVIGIRKRYETGEFYVA